MAKVSESKELRSLKEVMAASITKTRTNEVVGPAVVKFKQGRMTMHGREFPKGLLECVVVASTTERSYYEGVYDATNISAPDCFAIGDDYNDMVPHENVQMACNDVCKSCPMQEFGTARVGRGPACKTYRRLALFPVSALANPELIAKAQIATCKVSPTSVKNWAAYASDLADNDTAIWAAVTEIKCAPDDTTQQKITFKPVNEIKDTETLLAIAARLDEAQRLVDAVYEADEEEETKARKF